MGFWERIIKGRLFAGGDKDGSRESAEAAHPVQDVPQDDIPTVVAELEMDGHKCILESFDLDFRRKSGHDYMYAGVITLATTEALFPGLGRWVTLDSLQKDGLVRFYANETSLSQGALFEVGFYRARCMTYERRTDDDAKGILTRLEIVPQTIRIGHETIQNFH